VRNTGCSSKSPVNQLLYDGLLVLRTAGRTPRGMVTGEAKYFHMHKGTGMVGDRIQDARHAQPAG